MGFLKAVKHQIRVRVSDKLAERKAKDGIVDLPSHTIDTNRWMWDKYDWSQGGEEWTNEAMHPEQWKKDLLEKMMFRYILKGMVVLEIGPGAGRWSQHLQPIASKLILADIAPRCIEICKQRFADKSNIEYRVIQDNIEFLQDESIDRIWSYDVFVHINPSDIERYLRNFARILKPGGIAIIHHSGWEYESEKNGRDGFRSKMNAEVFAAMVEAAGMKVIEQNRDLVHKKGDIITVFMVD